MSVEFHDSGIRQTRSEPSIGEVRHQLETPNGKKMRVTIYNKSSSWPKPCAITYVENGPNHIRVPGTTTQLYAAAKELIQDEATVMGGDILYMLSTESEEMKRWALGPGMELFRWDKTPQEIPSGRMRLSTYISPRNLEQ